MKDQVPFSSQFKAASGPDVQFGSKAKLNRTKHAPNASQTLKDIARAMDSSRQGQSTNRGFDESQSPTKTAGANFIKKNKELASSARNLRPASESKADMFIASTQRHKPVKQKDLQIELGGLEGIQTGKRNIGVVVNGVYGEKATGPEASYNVKTDDEDLFA